MTPKVTRSDKQQMVRMRALDYSKQEIADEVGVSRSTVDYHLKQIREEIEGHSEATREFALAEFLFEPEDALDYAMEEIDNPLERMDLDNVSIPLSKVLGGEDN